MDQLHSPFIHPQLHLIPKYASWQIELHWECLKGTAPELSKVEKCLHVRASRGKFLFTLEPISAVEAEVALSCMTSICDVVDSTWQPRGQCGPRGVTMHGGLVPSRVRAFMGLPPPPKRCPPPLFRLTHER